MEQSLKHSVWGWLGKALLSGIIAFIVLTLLSLFYYNVPVHCAAADGETDSHLAPNSFGFATVEGAGWGRTNSDGYLNTFDFQRGHPIDVLIIGSSHMEALQVPQSASVTERLRVLLPNETIYNIGVGEHNFLTCSQNLSAAVEKYQPAKYVIMETTGIQFSDDSLALTIDGQYPEIPDHAEGFLAFLSRNQYLRILNRQLKFYNSSRRSRSSPDPSDKPDETQEQSAVQEQHDPALLGQLLALNADTVSASGARIIIAYHPSTTLNKDGTITFSTTEAEEDAFALLCKENGILFLNMRERFQQEYDENHVLPYGFANSAVGSGHMNKNGHRMMAEELYALMEEEGL